ncbi:hypothetical protein D9757_011785 [Collybiopsis confluens]|uniref:Uncharacterized protein n=1 Tax=Collybiopsis confluens TaxID=2823264 RepID=A0A8H5H104_9AGAR|nr:hypothetical protein D9757_011785 [Collybiopsis confluens]
MSNDESGLTQNEANIFRQDGEFIMENVIPIILEAAVWGVYVPIVALAISSLYKRGIKNSRARLTLCIVTLLMFTISTALFAVDLYTILIPMKHVNFSVKEGDILDNAVLESDFFVVRAFFVSCFLRNFNLLIGDLILIWRTWAFWHDQLIWVVIPITAWVATFAIFLTYMIMYGISPEFPFVALISNAGWTAVLGRLQLATWLLSMLTNFVATVMIAYKAWQYRKMIIEVNHLTAYYTKQTQIWRVLALTVESGIFYFILMGLQIMLIVGSFNYGPADVYNEIMDRVGEQLFGLYPTIIIVLVELGRTGQWSDPCVQTSEDHPTARENRRLSSIRFNTLSTPFHDSSLSRPETTVVFSDV